jgi:hypothetical protein
MAVRVRAYHASTWDVGRDFLDRRVLSLLSAGLVRAWRYLGGSHRIAKMRYALLLPFAMVHISFGLALYSSAADAKKVGAKNPPSWLTMSAGCCQ